MKLKVYGTSQWWKKDIGSPTCQCRVVVAAPSKKRAAELLEQSMYVFNLYTAETGNKKEVELAMAQPETVIITEKYRVDSEYADKRHIS